mmetsp:Transcript_72839/g.213669  ORF Transcript_72839/g.213669 Transcript_72839/m.213669 type:complete len:202 (-) Transcript_72839:6-611(-)
MMTPSCPTATSTSAATSPTQTLPRLRSATSPAGSARCCGASRTSSRVHSPRRRVMMFSASTTTTRMRTLTAPSTMPAHVTNVTSPFKAWTRMEVISHLLEATARPSCRRRLRRAPRSRPLWRRSSLRTALPLPVSTTSSETSWESRSRSSRRRQGSRTGTSPRRRSSTSWDSAQDSRIEAVSGRQPPHLKGRRSASWSAEV